MGAIDHLQGAQETRYQALLVVGIGQLEPADELGAGGKGLQQGIEEARPAKVMQTGYLTSTLAQA